MNAIENDYSKYRGKCKEFVDRAVEEDLTLTAIRGYYYCPITNRKEEHWWAKRIDGTIYDPTKNQFLSKGIGEYIEYNGIVECAECGKEIKEEDAIFYGNYAFCSGRCNGRFVGVF